MKKPKAKKVSVFSATELRNYVKLKHAVNDNGFWKWFFSECPWGDTNLLSLDDEDIIQPKFKNYFNALKKDFSANADEDLCLNIMNDL